jgi:UDP-GlcNAc:undecaprenyl-phosphate GlcNAc-1-phosphate transferase
MISVDGAVLITSVVVSALLTRFIRDLAKRSGWAAGAISSHHIHLRPISRLGGVAIFSGFVVMVSLYMIASRLLGWIPIGAEILKLIIPACSLFATGLWDDVRGLGAKAKLLGQILGGICLYASGIRFLGPAFEYSHLWTGPVVNFAGTVLWVVLISNAMNLIDGLDGLAAGVGLFSMVSILAFAWIGNVTPVVVITLILAGTVSGFLIFNITPASIFLGDSGSLFLGFMLSGLTLELSKRQTNPLNSLMMPMFFFALPLVDTGVSVLRRFLRRRPLFEADRRHIHHMLLKLGWTHREAVSLLYGIAAVCTILSFALLTRSQVFLAAAVAVLALMLFLGVRKLGYEEFSEIGAILRRGWAAKGADLMKVSSKGAEQAVPRILHTLVPAPADLDISKSGRASVLPEAQPEEAAG